MTLFVFGLVGGSEKRQAGGVRGKMSSMMGPAESHRPLDSFRQSAFVAHHGATSARRRQAEHYTGRDERPRTPNFGKVQFNAS